MGGLHRRAAFRLSTWLPDAVTLVAVIACLWASSRSALSSRLWMDDLITLSLAQDPSLAHVFDAIWRGLDNTPPPYVLLGWTLHGLLPAGSNVAAALRAFNGAFLALSLLLLGRLARRFVPTAFAVACVCAFVLLQRGYVGYLLVEVRTYALFFLCATLCLFRTLEDVAPRSPGPRLRTALCLLAVTASHTFGVVYACILAFAAALTFAVGGRWSGAKREAACLAPSIVAVALWLPVLRHQAAIPSWIQAPTARTFVAALHPPEGPAAAAALAAATALSAWVLRGSFGRRAFGGADPPAVLLLALPLATGLAMLAIWLESRLGFPVFIPRYFGFNALLTFAALLACAAAAVRALPAAAARGPLVAGVALAAVCADLLLVPFAPDDRIPCVDPATGAFLEDGAGRGLPVLAPFSTAWLPRARSPGRQALFPAEGHLTAADRARPQYGNSQSYAPAFAAWAGLDALRTDAQLAALPDGFLVVDDGQTPWLQHAASGSALTLEPVLQSATCRVWRARAARPGAD